LSVSPVSAEVNFAEFSVRHVISPQKLQEAAETSATAQVAGVAAYPEVDGSLYAAHLDNEGHITFLRVQVHSESATWLTDSHLISTQLGVPYTQDLELFGGIAFSLQDNSIYFGENRNGGKGEGSLIRIDANTGTAQLVKRDQVIGELVDHAVLPDGKILASRTGSGLKAIGIINPVTGLWDIRVDEAQLLAAAPGANNLVPQSVAASAITGDVYTYGAGDSESFRIAGISRPSPVIHRLSQPQLQSAVFSDIAVDQAGNMFGLDLAGQQVLVVRVTDGAVFSVSLQQIASALGGTTPFMATSIRGLAARSAGRGQVDLFLASATSAYGIVRVRFGVHPAAVGCWELY
jgi:hypothetical protein